MNNEHMLDDASNWKPVPHSEVCMFDDWLMATDPKHIPCTCDGTRWHGYGERVGDLAGVINLFTIFSLMGGESSVNPALRKLVHAAFHLMDDSEEFEDGRLSIDCEISQHDLREMYDALDELEINDHDDIDAVIYTHPPAAVPASQDGE